MCKINNFDIGHFQRSLCRFLIEYSFDSTNKKYLHSKEVLK